MKLFYIMLLIFSGILNYSYAQEYTLDWARTLGGKDWDEATCVVETKDKCHVIAGYTKPDNKYMWMIKIDANGNTIWGKKYDEYFCEAKSIVETAEDKNCDLIIIGKHHRSKLSTLFFEDKSDVIKELCKLPILVIPVD